MAFPQTPLPLKVELDLGGWTDVTSYVRGGPGISITRGRVNESSQAERTQATLTLENPDGRFSERNPTGPYYGLLSLNTPCRISLDRGSRVFEIPGGQTDLAWAADAAALDITGDIDVRVDAHLHDWRTSSVLACKWRSVSGDQRSWAFVSDEGYLKLWWSTAGTAATRTSVTSTARVPVSKGRLAVRVTLDVNNGASGHTATFYTSDTISGSWTQLGDAVVTSGTTSIFSSTSRLEAGGYTEAGDSSLSSSDLYGYTSVYGWLYAFQLRNGIAGTVVANPDFTSPAAGATSFADTASSPNTWTLISTDGSRITDRYWVMHGEVSKWPQTWDVTKRNAVVSITVAGPLRRITQGSDPLRSVMARSILPLEGSSLKGYWPCEDAEGSTTLASGLANGSAMVLYGTPTFGAYSGFAASGPLPSFGSSENSYWAGDIAAYTSNGVCQFRFLLRLASGLADNTTIVGFVANSTAFEAISVVYDTANSGSIYLKVVNSGGGTTLTSSSIGSSLPETDVGVSVNLVQNGANIDYTLGLHTISTGAYTSTTGSAAGTLGVANQVRCNPGLNAGDTVTGHYALATEVIDSTTLTEQFSAYARETAGRRFERLCDEHGIAFRSIGDLDDSEAMGGQRAATLVDLLRECATADLGMVFEPRDVLGLGYRTRRSLENQTNGVDLDYAAHELPGDAPPIPTGDDLAVRNDVTVSRTGGSSARAELATGRMSTAAPPSGVGRYPTSEPINVESDDRLASHANFRLLLGTVDEERYPLITVKRTTPAVVANASLNAELLTVNPGDVLSVGSMPTPFVAPGGIRQIVQGWSEKLSNFEHTFVFNATPASVWDLGLVSDGDYGRVDTDGSELVSAVDSSATSLVVASTDGPYWTEAAGDMPFDLMVAGEQITVTDVDRAVSDTFTRSASNGWGSATTGQAWTRSGGDAADFSVNGSAGVIDVDTVNSERWMTLAQTSPAWDCEMRARTLVTATGASISAYIGLMLTGVSSGYLARMAFHTDQTVRVSIERVPFSLLASEVTVGGLTHAANTWFRLRFKAQDGVLQARVWADGGTEPVGWHVRATDTTYTSGGMGLRANLSSGNTNTLPVVVQYDDLTSHNPQTFTVTRGVNSVSKSQSASADIRLLYPTIISL